jgi:hypothetical protein
MIHWVLAAVRSCPNRSTRVPRRSGVIQLANGILWIQFDWMCAFAEFESPFGVLGEEAPVVSGSNGIDQVKMRTGIGGEIDGTVVVVVAGDDGGDAHIEIGVGLSLGVHAGKAVDEAGNEEFASAVHNASAFGDGYRSAGAYVSDAAVTDDDNGARDVARGVAPGGEIDESAAGENQRGGRRSGLWLRFGRN